jgi:hypothetical protein
MKVLNNKAMIQFAPEAFQIKVEVEDIDAVRLSKK